MRISIIYEVQFPDFQVKYYVENSITENILSQVDDEGCSVTIVDSIVDYKRYYLAVDKAKNYGVTRRGQRRFRNTNQGGKIIVSWKNGYYTCIPLNDIEGLNPVGFAEFSKARVNDDDPVFSFQVTYAIRKRDFIISSIKWILRKTMHKYGIVIPTSVYHAY